MSVALRTRRRGSAALRWRTRLVRFNAKTNGEVAMRDFKTTLLGLSLGLACLAWPGAAAAQTTSRGSANGSAGVPKATYVGTEVCQGCHPDQYDEFKTTKMGQLFIKAPKGEHEKLGCEACHGPGSAHADAGGKKPGLIVSFAKGDKTSVAERNATCLSCHDRTARLFWQGSQHESRDVACTSCHTLMTNASERAQLKKATVTETCAQCHPQRAAQLARFSHMPFREGKLDCASCHNPHGSPTEKLLKGNSVNDVCYSCHAEKRGPFLHEHAPVVENCSNCHEAHGTNNEKMLVVSKPRLCQRCHDGNYHPARSYNLGSSLTAPAASRYIMERQCVNCHFAIHGSNHPSGSAFTR